ncbi:MAG: metal-sensitive transcriptional repressor family protein [Stackebrandtia sp.]
MPPQAPAETLTERIERRLTVPVLVAAVVSVPAVFLAAWGSGGWAITGIVIDALAGALLWFEWIILLLLAENKREWLKRHRWTLLIVVLTIPAVVFALGPFQLLRIVYSIATLRVLRVRRIISAGRVVQRRLELSGLTKVILAIGVSALCLVFSAVLLFDPNSDTWVVAELVVRHLDIGPTAILGVALLLIAFLLWRNRRRDKKAMDESG